MTLARGARSVPRLKVRLNCLPGTPGGGAAGPPEGRRSQQNEHIHIYMHKYVQCVCISPFLLSLVVGGRQICTE